MGGWLHFHFLTAFGQRRRLSKTYELISVLLGLLIYSRIYGQKASRAHTHTAPVGMASSLFKNVGLRLLVKKFAVRVRGTMAALLILSFAR